MTPIEREQEIKDGIDDAIWALDATLQGPYKANEAVTKRLTRLLLFINNTYKETYSQFNTCPYCKQPVCEHVISFSKEGKGRKPCVKPAS